MIQLKKVTKDMFWIGGNDRRLALFENVFPIPNGISYNSYFINDEQTVILDTVDRSISEVFFENISYLLNGRKLDYVVVNHMEPDHAATLSELILRYPETKIICNARTVTMMHQFFDFDIDNRAIIMKEKDTITIGRHTLQFIMAPMVHWPEVMVTYDTTDKVLYSADAFGTFGALNGHIFADKVDFETFWLPEARRYYTNIVGKFGQAVQALLSKTSILDIAMICPLHGPVWRTNIGWYLEKYQKWSSYTPEDQAVMIAYASVYGNTENAVNILASELDELGVENIKIYDVSKTHTSELVSEAFRCSHLVFASITYNGGIFCNMETLLRDLQTHNIQNRTIAFMENGSWTLTAGSKMSELCSSMKNMTLINSMIQIHSTLKKEQYEEIKELAVNIYASMHMQVSNK